jgi:hypothetical protein
MTIFSFWYYLLRVHSLYMLLLGISLDQQMLSLAECSFASPQIGAPKKPYTTRSTYSTKCIPELETDMARDLYG